ncbi:MAG: sigma-70 family RNA polymerase sigma factor [Myxococcales bacterium]|nr:MAG: sigma-70 family RNA polymerase sigma factor [Myxococcales bacterium]
MVENHHSATNPRDLSWSDTQTREALAQYRGLLIHLAKKYSFAAQQCGGLDTEDLVSEGQIATLEALRDFRNFGMSEKNWVALRVRQRMIDAIRRMDPRSRTTTCRSQTHEAETANPSPPRLRLVHGYKNTQEKAPIYDYSQAIRLVADSDTPTADDIVYRNSQRQLIATALTYLSERQRMALQLKLQEDLDLQEIGIRMGISISRVRQLQQRAIANLHQLVVHNSEAQTA